MTRKKLPPIPQFKNHQEEMNFWNTHILTDYLDFRGRKRVVYQKNLDQGVTIRFSSEDLARLRKIAAKKGVGPTTFIRSLIRAYLEKLLHSV